MPRKTRMYLPGVPIHVVQRGNNRQACFFRDDDYHYFKELLSEGLGRYGGQLHAYCLMHNHVHLLITPEELDSISRIIQHVSRQYVQHINKYYRRSGTLWEGRYKASLVDAEDYLMTCYRYIELNPVTANIVKNPDEYRWSSYSSNAWGEVDLLISPHELYIGMGLTKKKRLYNYRELFTSTIPPVDIHQVKYALNKNLPLGNEIFRRQTEAALGRKIGADTRGRPRRSQTS